MPTRSPIQHDEPQSDATMHGVELLGVLFAWHGKGSMPMPAVGPAKDELLARIEEAVAPAKRRQKRKDTEYWDAMTFLQRGPVPPIIANSFEGGLLEDLIEMTGRARFEDPTVAAFSEQELFRHTSTRLRLVTKEWYRSQLIVPRVGPKPWPNAPLDPRVRLGLHQMIEIDQTALDIAPGKADIGQMLMHAVSAQLHADLQVYYQTGFMRIRRCQHAGCRAFFAAKRMDIRSRFCSANCRVASARSDAKGLKPKLPAWRRRTFIK